MSGASSPYTTEYHYELASHTRQLLRRRFLWFTGVIATIGLAGLAFVTVQIARSDMPDKASLTRVVGDHPLLILVLSVASVVIYIGAFLYAISRKQSGEQILRCSLALVIIDGLINLAGKYLGGPPPMGIFGFLISYSAAAAVLPWTVRQAVIPAVTVLGIAGLYRVSPLGDGPTGLAIGQSALLFLAAVPAVLNAWWRQSSRVKQFQFSFMQRRYGDLRRELTDARRIHEAMFPAPKMDGAVRFTYRYQPMRQIGGDYLHVALSPTDCGTAERLCVVVLDVTGHGIPAALNVNRLYGELERIFAEDPCIDPGDVLKLLNRYVRLTMSTHSVYVTGLAVRIDPITGVLEYANAGHPPAFHLGVDGTIDQLDSTTYLLGAVGDEDFDPHTREVIIAEGDRLIAYTDGATEATNDAGRMLGIRGMQGVLASSEKQPEGGWPAVLLAAVDGHRDGPPKDDTLLIELFRPIGVAVERADPLQSANDESHVPAV
ncbi:MAG: PP2C family protein-serine/threonine phosphatase [Planctomycetota bacterium]